MNNLFGGFLAKNWGKLAGGLLGLIAAILFLTVGFWPTILILFCTLMGLLIGWLVDRLANGKIGNIFDGFKRDN